MGIQVDDGIAQSFFGIYNEPIRSERILGSLPNGTELFESGAVVGRCVGVG